MTKQEAMRKQEAMKNIESNPYVSEIEDNSLKWSVWEGILHDIETKWDDINFRKIQRIHFQKIEKLELLLEKYRPVLIAEVNDMLKRKPNPWHREDLLYSIKWHIKDNPLRRTSRAPKYDEVNHNAGSVLFEIHSLIIIFRYENFCMIYGRHPEPSDPEYHGIFYD